MREIPELEGWEAPCFRGAGQDWAGGRVTLGGLSHRGAGHELTSGHLRAARVRRLQAGLLALGIYLYF